MSFDNINKIAVRNFGATRESLQTKEHVVPVLAYSQRNATWWCVVSRRQRDKENIALRGWTFF